ncbi:MAG: ATP-binding cassette domain-containing protein, partial [Pseudoclavibacter sp.]
LVVSSPEGGGPSIMGAVAGLRAPHAGAVSIAGRNLAALDPATARRERYELVGYVLRDIGLDPELTVTENIASPLRFVQRSGTGDEAQWLATLAQSFGLVNDLDRRAGALDVGTQQRVAIARALATKPSLVYADEPVARLGERDGRVVLALLRTIAHEYGIALAICTTDASIVSQCERVIAVRDGLIVGDRRGASAEWLDEVLGLGGSRSDGGDAANGAPDGVGPAGSGPVAFGPA